MHRHGLFRLITTGLSVSSTLGCAARGQAGRIQPLGSDLSKYSIIRIDVTADGLAAATAAEEQERRVAERLRPRLAPLVVRDRNEPVGATEDLLLAIGLTRVRQAVGAVAFMFPGTSQIEATIRLIAVSDSTELGSFTVSRTVPFGAGTRAVRNQVSNAIAEVLERTYRREQSGGPQAHATTGTPQRIGPGGASVSLGFSNVSRSQAAAYTWSVTFPRGSITLSYVRSEHSVEDVPFIARGTAAQYSQFAGNCDLFVLPGPYVRPFMGLSVGRVVFDAGETWVLNDFIRGDAYEEGGLIGAGAGVELYLTRFVGLYGRGDVRWVGFYGPLGFFEEERETIRALSGRSITWAVGARLLL